MAAADAIDVALVGQVLRVEPQRQPLVNRVGDGGVELPVARRQAHVGRTVPAVVDELRAAADLEARAEAVGRPRAERVLGRVGELLPHFRRRVRLEHLALEVGVADVRHQRVGEAAVEPDLHAAHLLAALEHGRRIAGIDAGRARVGLLGLEQGAGREHAPIEQLPLDAELRAPALLGLDQHRGRGQAQSGVAFGRRVERRAVGSVEAALRPRLVDDARAPAQHVVVALEVGERVGGVHRVEVDVERVVAQTAHQLEALTEAHGVEGVGGGGVGGVLGARPGVDDRSGVRSVRIGIEEIGERRVRSGAGAVLGGLP